MSKGWMDGCIKKISCAHNGISCNLKLKEILSHTITLMNFDDKSKDDHKKQISMIPFISFEVITLLETEKNGDLAFWADRRTDGKFLMVRVFVLQDEKVPEICHTIT
jgi:hypothetical protein